MKKLLYKEFRLAASPLTYIFTVFSLMAFIPGYPILVGTFFVTLGIFYSFQTSRENRDVAYGMLLPVSKADTVRGKFAFVTAVELFSFALSAAVTLVRMTVLRDAPAYVQNALMCANFVYLGFVLLICGLYNLVFVAGFYKTAYYFAKPFVAYIIVAMLTVAAAETLHHLPGLGALNSFGFENLALQLSVLAAGALAFVLMTWAAVGTSIRRFEKIDL